MSSRVWNLNPFDVFFCFLFPTKLENLSKRAHIHTTLSRRWVILAAPSPVSCGGAVHTIIHIQPTTTTHAHSCEPTIANISRNTQSWRWGKKKDKHRARESNPFSKSSSEFARLLLRVRIFECVRALLLSGSCAACVSVCVRAFHTRALFPPQQSVLFFAFTWFSIFHL